MKKMISLLLVCALAGAMMMTLTACGNTSVEKPIRIHIRANSNSDADQAVKLVVRDAVINYLSPKLKNAADISSAYVIISDNINSINKLAESTLSKNNFGYGAESSLTNEYFPTRSYNGKVFESGNYDALIVNLGTGSGDNWWCVAYPPLCFYGNDSVEYSSIIAEWFLS